MMKDFGTFRTEEFMSESDFVGATDKRNNEGYHDPVPYLVMKNDAEWLRFRRFIDVIFKVARLCGFYITGKLWSRTTLQARNLSGFSSRDDEKLKKNESEKWVSMTEKLIFLCDFPGHFCLGKVGFGQVAFGQCK